MTDKRSPWDTTGITIVNDIDLIRTTVYGIAGEAIRTGDEMAVSMDDGRIYRATGTDIRMGPASRDYAAGDRITLWPPFRVGDR